MKPLASHAPVSRRDVLKTASCGFGYLALAGMCAKASAAAVDPLAARTPHFEPKAKRVIFLFMRGGPTHLDTFDHKPRLEIDDGKQTATEADRKYMRSAFEFRPRGQSGLMISDAFPHVAKHADDLCLLNGMHTDIPNHPQAIIQLHTGNFQFVRPSLGSWVLYGLGTENENLPGFVTINPSSRLGGAQNYGSAFLPAAYQATRIGNEGDDFADAEIEHIANEWTTRGEQRRQLALLRTLNRDRLARDVVNNELEGVIQSYELAFRMQSAVPELMDLSRETQATLEKYGVGNKETDNFGRQCLMARRAAEAGVRFIEIAHSTWDQHQNLRKQLGSNCMATDQPIGALLCDLKQRGLLDDTLVVWGGEFGRTPGVRRADGRDHNATGYSMWLAGGGVKGGLRFGATDDHGQDAVENKVHIHDLHATILHLLGLDHEKLTYRYSGRDFRLTDVHGRVVNEIMA